MSRGFRGILQDLGNFFLECASIDLRHAAASAAARRGSRPRAVSPLPGSTGSPPRRRRPGGARLQLPCRAPAVRADPSACTTFVKSERVQPPRLTQHWILPSSVSKKTGGALKGGHREVASEGSVEQRREPMHKNRIEGDRDRMSERKIAKSISVKGHGRRSGGCAPKAVGLTPGGLRRCPGDGTGGTERNPERGAGVSRGHSRWWQRAGAPEGSPPLKA